MCAWHVSFSTYNTLKSLTKLLRSINFKTRIWFSIFILNYSTIHNNGQTLFVFVKKNLSVQSANAVTRGKDKTQRIRVQSSSRTYPGDHGLGTYSKNETFAIPRNFLYLTFSRVLNYLFHTKSVIIRRIGTALPSLPYREFRPGRFIALALCPLCLRFFFQFHFQFNKLALHLFWFDIINSKKLLVKAGKEHQF